MHAHIMWEEMPEAAPSDQRVFRAHKVIPVFTGEVSMDTYESMDTPPNSHLA